MLPRAGLGPRYDRQLHQPCIGRVSLRGVVRVRHVALTATTVPKQYSAGHSTSTGVRGGENAWDSTGDWNQGEFTFPCVRERAVRCRAGS